MATGNKSASALDQIRKERIEAGLVPFKLVKYFSFSSLAAVDWQGVETKVWAGIIYLAVFSTIITFYLTHIATLYLGPTRVMAYSYFYPAFVMVINWGFDKGLPPLAILPGVAVVTLATIALQWDSKIILYRSRKHMDKK